jgi:pyrroline-5-carboxylate reductase
MNRPRIAFIGGGNMARSIIGGLVAGGHPADRIAVADPSAEQRERLEREHEVTTSADGSAVTAAADVVVLAVKPQIMADVARGLTAAVADARPLVVSVAAGIREDALARWLDYDGPIVRCMPNTPALIQCGMSALHANAAVTADQREMAETLLAATGDVVWVDAEADLDIVTAISGSGPAYYFAFMEAMEQAALARGLPADTARHLVLGTALGAARMARESGDDPGTLRANVTSRGGTTAAGLAAFEAGGLATLVDNAVDAARQRSIELGDELGEA